MQIQSLLVLVGVLVPSIAAQIVCDDGNCRFPVEACSTCPQDCGDCAQSKVCGTLSGRPGESCSVDEDCGGMCNFKSINSRALCKENSDCIQGVCRPRTIRNSCLESPACIPTAPQEVEGCAIENLKTFDPCDDVETVLEFAALGDVPYSLSERYCLNSQLRDIPNDLNFIAHVGDIKPGSDPCTEASYTEIASMFLDESNSASYQASQLFWTVGDNEWVDCTSPSDMPNTLYYDRWKTQFGADNVNGFGTLAGTGITVNRQSSKKIFSGADRRSRDENFSFLMGNVVVIGINMVGGGSYGTESDWKKLLRQNFVWVRDQLASYPDKVAAVILSHADFENEARSLFGKKFLNLMKKTYTNLPVMFIHGDRHKSCVDYPELKRLPNLVVVTLEDGGQAPPLLISVEKRTADDTYRFRIDAQGGKYDGACPGIAEQTW